ncbi:hypothetical protein [Nocardia higoensis]|uniref:hypothetical protein n=1 Tax=Nocardia higoensis TaxID=228599 RepID=UPI0012F6E1E4|nr:hypothetical protein [Nocardia higoensis]
MIAYATWGMSQFADSERLEFYMFAAEADWMIENHVESRADGVSSASPGKPGQLIIDPEASYGAWLHETRHMLDDMESGWRGFRMMADRDVRAQWERRAYHEEIEHARLVGDETSVVNLHRLLKRNSKRFIEESGGMDGE